MSPPPAPKRAKATAKAKPKSTKECCVYDATISAAGVSSSDLHSALRPICKKWTFQLECSTVHTVKNPDGYLHYQCRVNLVKKKSISAAITTASSTNSIVDDAFYCMKDDSREPGPDSGPFTEKDYREKPVLTEQMRPYPDRLPWHDALLAEVKDFDMRTIHCVLCPVGCACLHECMNA